MIIGVVTTSYPRFHGDAAGNFVGEHVAALRAIGHTVEVIAAGDADTHDASDAMHGIYRVPSRGLFYRGGAPDLLEQQPIRGALSAAVFSARLAAAVSRRARGRWDSIIAHWLAPSALAALPARKPLLAIAHGGDVHTLRRRGLLARALRALHARDAHLVFVSDELRAIAIAEAPRLEPWISTAIVQPMGIDLARFAAIPRIPTEPPTIAIAARLVPIKGVDVAIAALEHVHHRVRLVIAGDGPDRKQLLQIAGSRYAPQVVVVRDDPTRVDRTDRDARIENVGRLDHLATPDPRIPRFDTASGSSVEFHGAIDTRARDVLLSLARLVVVPSRIVNGRSEGTPMIALEALAAGVPVVASDVGGLHSLAPAVTLVPPDDPRALAAAIDRVLEAPPMAETLRESVAHLDWRRVIATLWVERW